MPNAVDIFIAYKFIKALAMPWVEWDAYKLGLIDANGDRIKRATTPEEKEAFPKWKILVRNIKRVLDKLPFGKTRLASFAASLYLLREETEIQNPALLEQEFMTYIQNSPILLESDSIVKIINMPKGMYLHRPTGNVIVLKEDNYHIGESLGYEIFRLIDNITKKEYTVIGTDVEPFNVK